MCLKRKKQKTIQRTDQIDVNSFLHQMVIHNSCIVDNKIYSLKLLQSFLK